jgi:hypothetical protein
MFNEPMQAVQIWLLVMSAAFDWNGKIFEVGAALNKEWLDFVGRQLYVPFGIDKKELGGTAELVATYVPVVASK